MLLPQGYAVAVNLKKNKKTKKTKNLMGMTKKNEFTVEARPSKMSPFRGDL